MLVTHLGADVTVLATFLSFLSATEEGALMATSPALGQLLSTFRTVTFLGVPCLSSGLPLLQLPSFGGACGVPRLVFTGRGMDAIPPVAAMPPVAPPYCPLRRRWLCYLKHTAGTGWGVHAGRTIPTGTPLLTYTGEVISTEETRRRQAAEYDLGPGRTRNYVLTTREHSCTHVLRTNVDATHVGGVARFVNHSCAPNLRVEMVRAGGHGQVVATAVLVTRAVVAPGEQLTFSYAGDGDNGDDEDDDGGAAAKRRRVPCACGAATCVGWLPYSTR